MQQDLIRYNFNACAAHYKQYAQIQKIAADKLLCHLPQHHRSGHLIDLGSGPGTLGHGMPHNYPAILYDLSIQMLKASQPTTGTSIMAINGDAGYLPFATNSIATVMSNLMIQWCEDKPLVLKEIKRILSQDGIFLFTTLINPSLWQLTQAWGRLDKAAHTLEFSDQLHYTNLMKRSGLSIMHSETWDRTIYFSDIYALLQHFKLTGTSMPKSQRGKGLGNKTLFRNLSEVYPKDIQTNTYPLNYSYLFMIVKNEE